MPNTPSPKKGTAGRRTQSPQTRRFTEEQESTIPKSCSDSSLYPIHQTATDVPIIRYEEQQQDEDESIVEPFKPNSSFTTSTPVLANELTQRKQMTAKQSFQATQDSVIAGNLHMKNSYILHEQTEMSIDDENDKTLSPVVMLSNLYADLCDAYNRHGVMPLLKYCLLIVAIVLGTVAVIQLLSFSCTGRSVEIHTAYRKEIASLRKLFPKLRKSDLNTLLVVGQQWILDDTQEPTVLTIGGPNAERFLNKLNDVVSNVTDNYMPVISGSSSLARPNLHKSLKSALSRSGSFPFAALTAIDSLSWEAPLVLHAFADSDSSPVPNSLLLLSVSMDSFDKQKCDESLESVLSSNWLESGGIDDSISPIISRVLGYTICI